MYSISAVILIAGIFFSAYAEIAGPSSIDATALPPEQKRKFEECADTGETGRRSAAAIFDNMAANADSDYDPAEAREVRRRVAAQRAGYIEQTIAHRQRPKYREFCFVSSTRSQDETNAWIERNRDVWLAGAPTFRSYFDDLKSRSRKRADAEWSVKRADIDAFFDARARGEVAGTYRETWRTSATVTNVSTASSCQPGPRCRSADVAAQAKIRRWGSGMGVSVHGSSVAAYCSNAEVVKVARVCEQEFRAAGNRNCANIAAQQAAASQAVANDALRSARQSSASANWSPQC